LADRAGKSLGNIGELQRQNSPTLSPDGRKVTVVVEEGETDLWVYDLDRGGRTRLTLDPAFERVGTWTPRGDQITYTAFRNGIFDLLSKPSSGNGEEKLLVRTLFPQMDPAWSPDGRFLLTTAVSPETKADLVYRERRNDGTLGEPVVFLKTRFNEAAAQFSPDGRFNKLGVTWEATDAEQSYNEGRSTQVPLNPVVRVKGRFSRRLRDGNLELVLER
jgi:Tol biopolymer transport system component